MKEPLIYIRHILICIEKIQRYTTDMSESQFLSNEIIQDAVIRNFEVIGEATKKLDLDFHEKHPNIEWKKIAGMRDKLIHDYIGVDLWAVWMVVEKILPELKKDIRSIIDQENPN